MNPRLLALSLVLIGATSCGHVERSEKATNVEDAPSRLATLSQPAAEPEWTSSAATEGPSREYTEGQSPAHKPGPPDTAPAPQKIQGAAKAQELPYGAPNPKLAEAQALYQSGLKETADGAFTEAHRIWTRFIDLFTGLPGYEQAQYNQALCLYHLGRPADSVEPLKGLIQSTGNPVLANDARILLIEALLQAGARDEALALTFDVLPDTRSEKDVGLHRQRGAVGVSAEARPDLAQKIRLYTLRGRIYASLGQEQRAATALAKAQELLGGPGKTKLSQAVRNKLEANWSWRQLEVTTLVCQARHKPPEHLSEAEFLAYADAYYGCATPARSLFCNVLSAKDEQIRSQALVTYRGLVEAPLELRNHLPPPAREVRKKYQRPYYESEMKSLIEKTVEARAKGFKNLEICNSFDLF